MNFWTTVSPILKEVLEDLMIDDLFSPYRVVGGTALSLQYGHRMSVDIDLFTDADYDSLNYDLYYDYFTYKYPYVKYGNLKNVAFGTYFIVGYSEENSVKVDIYYTDDFIFDEIKNENIRMASDKEIIAMKLNVLLNGGRKKDFWDLHYFLNKYTFDEMISFYEKRYPYNGISTLKNQFINFENADNDVEPICLLNKSWEIFKLDFYEKLNLRH